MNHEFPSPDRLHVDRRQHLAFIGLALAPTGRLDLAGINDLFQAIDEVAALPPGWAVVMRSDGDHFCDGLDLTAFHRSPPATQRLMLRLGARIALRMMKLPIPFVTAAHGRVAGLGAAVMLAADARLATEEGFELHLGEDPFGGFVAAFARAVTFTVGATGRETAVDGEALAAKAVQERVPHSELLPRASERARELASVPREQFGPTKLAWRRPTYAAAKAGLAEDLARLAPGVAAAPRRPFGPI